MASASIVVSSGLHGCELLNNDEDLTVNFQHGVANNDPLSDRAIIWTRVTPSKQTAVVLA